MPGRFGHIVEYGAIMSQVGTCAQRIRAPSPEVGGLYAQSVGAYAQRVGAYAAAVVVYALWPEGSNLWRGFGGVGGTCLIGVDGA